MNKKTRYLILAATFTVFLILSPVIILYVRGVTYDFTTHSFVSTGILTIRTEPADVRIFLDGRLKRLGSGDIRFVLPGEHQVEIKKDGYNSWSKRLFVGAGQLTWANPEFNSIFLLLTNPQVKTLSQGVKDFYLGQNTLAYLTGNSFIISSLSRPNSGLVFPLPTAARAYSGQVLNSNSNLLIPGQALTINTPAPLPGGVDKILAADQENKNFVLYNSRASSTPLILYFDSASGKFSNLSGLFSSTPKIQFFNGGLLALDGDILLSVDPIGQKSKFLLSGVKCFYIENNNLYFIQGGKQGQSALLVAPLPFNGATQLLVNNLIPFSHGDLFVTYGKQILLAADGGLYLINNNMEKLADNISLWDFSQDSLAVIVHAGELDYFDPSTQTLNFITRSGEMLNNPEILTVSGWAFYASSNKIKAIELDTRGGQNQYDIYQGQNPQKFAVDNDGKNLLLLDDGVLKSLVVR